MVEEFQGPQSVRSLKIKIALRLLAAAIVLALLIWVAARVDWRELGDRLFSASQADLVLMATTWTVAWLIRPIRFRYLLRVLGHADGANYRTVWTALVLGATVNIFTALRAGDVAITVFLLKRLRIGVHRSFSVIVADWICDFLCVVLAFAGALAFAPAMPSWTGHAVTVLVTVSIVAIATLWLSLYFRARVVALLDFGFKRVTPSWRTWARHVADEFLATLAAIGTLRAALTALAISLLIWGLVAVSYWFGLRAVFESASIAAAVFCMAAVTLSFVVPLSPGALGAFEAAAILALAVFEVPLEPALASAVIIHALQLTGTLLFAGLALATRQLDFRLWPAKDGL